MSAVRYMDERAARDVTAVVVLSVGRPQAFDTLWS